MTNAQALREIRLMAKSNGLTFKVQPGATLNGGSMYMFADRKTGETVIRNCTIDSAYNDCMSGYIDSYDTKSGQFDGVTPYE